MLRSGKPQRQSERSLTSLVVASFDVDPGLEGEEPGMTYPLKLEVVRKVECHYR